MAIEKFRYLQGVIAAHNNHTVCGRTRLQKTVRILQRIGFPTDYDFTLFFYGPYSESMHFDLGLLKSMKAIEEDREVSKDESPAYRIRAVDIENAADVSAFRNAIEQLQRRDSVVLELAATFDAYLEMGCNEEDAEKRLRRKKEKKCTPKNFSDALNLLQEIGLKR